MLKLVDIKKDYVMSDDTVHALKGVSVNFRRNEFVAILGPSGCGKTTLLNIVGGLDRYTSGDLIIEGKSTKNYKDGDWDTYRNHSIGFIFQSYNLINHINILKNVELALTISGVNKQERKIRAEKALEIVGLKGQGKKKPNQLSGGQCQRVAIARALINNPEIVLADEPTGALDSETSVQIMELLKEVAKDRLVVMVTHNPELANRYATRIIKVKDGEIIDDSDPYEGESEKELQAALQKRITRNESKGAKKLTSMSFKTALALSGNNLLSKKTRTMLISFAGSIGIIGIALILSLSSGFNNYIMEVQTNSMSTYPLTIRKSSSSAGMSDMMGALMGQSGNHPKYPDDEMLIENSVITDLLSQMITLDKNDTESFKKYIEDPENAEKFKDVTTDIQYTYGQALNIFATTDFNGEPIKEVTRLSPISGGYKDNVVYHGNTYHTMSGDPLSEIEQQVYDHFFPGAAKFVSDSVANLGASGRAFGTLLDNEPLLNEQFDILQGHLPQKVDEVVIKLNVFNQVSDLFLYEMGLKDISYMMGKYIYSLIESDDKASTIGFHKPEEDPSYTASFSDLMNLEFSIVLKTQYYEKIMDSSSVLGYRYKDMRSNHDEFLKRIQNSLKLKVVGIVRPKKGVAMDSFNSAIGYHPDLYEYLVNQAINPTIDSPFYGYDVLKDQMANPHVDLLTGQTFEDDENVVKTKYDSNLKGFGYVDYSSPDSIYLYPKSFEDKDKILDLINEYNRSVTPKHRLTVVDNVGAMLSSMQTIVDSVGYVLIAFVSISLLVSSIMIGIITYVSVLERTKEIGVLRSIGARKKDIRRVFNAETLIIGLSAGLLGIAVASLLNLPIMFIINALTDIGLTIIVPWYGAIVLPVISILLTIVAGLIPSSIAAKRDPVIALRTE